MIPGKIVSAIKGATGWPIVHRADYSKANLYVLTIPDNFSDLYQYPPEVLNRIRSIVSGDLNVKIEGPSMVSLFCYDNGTFIVHSFLPEPVSVKILVRDPADNTTDLLTGETIQVLPVKPDVPSEAGPKYHSFEITIKPHSYRVIGTR